nr:MAG TPA: hypothetical protein [Caudoviricetes sp.]
MSASPPAFQAPQSVFPVRSPCFPPVYRHFALFWCILFVNNVEPENRYGIYRLIVLKYV